MGGRCSTSLIYIKYAYRLSICVQASEGTSIGGMTRGILQLGVHVVVVWVHLQTQLSLCICTQGVVVIKEWIGPFKGRKYTRGGQCGCGCGCDSSTFLGSTFLIIKCCTPLQPLTLFT